MRTRSEREEMKRWEGEEREWEKKRGGGEEGRRRRRKEVKKKTRCGGEMSELGRMIEAKRTRLIVFSKTVLCQMFNL